ncbi:MAG: glycoside hydrolase family 38 N-terminal domain-containing protein [Eubacteriales bacterium]
MSELENTGISNIYNVCSSHMDREWYLPFEENRIFFDRIIHSALQHLKNDSGFCFILDGQTSVLQDYLEIYPEREDEIREYIRQSRLIIGPWFIQPDEVIPFGESMIRNLLLGEKLAKKFGDVMHIGYIPDAFGHPAQLPQIFRQFGISRVFLMRGVPADIKREFIWRGPDGSEMISICYEYGCASFMDPDNMRSGIRMMSAPQEYEQRKEEAFNNPRKVAPYTLMTIGGDMQALPKDLRGLGIDHFNRYEECFEETEKHLNILPVVTGELRYSDDIRYLQDTLVSRIYLKIENRRIQTLLSQFAEPAALMAYGTANEYPGGFIDKAWQYLIENHTHDGICGCSSDDTCDDIMNRFRRCGNIADRVFKTASAYISGQIDTENLKDGETALTVFNTQSFRADYAVDFELRYYAEIAPVSFLAYDKDGSEVPVHIRDRQSTGTIESDFGRMQQFSQDTFISATILVKDIPSFGYRTYRIVPAAETACVYKLADEAAGTAENTFIRIKINADGTMDIFDKTNNKNYDGINYLLDQSNGGDAYNFKPLQTEQDYDSRALAWNIRCTQNSAVLAEFELTAAWPLPIGLNEDMTGRLSEFVQNHISMTVRITADSPVAAISLTIENKAKDHRICAVFPFGVSVNNIAADSPFYIEHRGTESFGTRQPSSTFVDIGSEHAGMALLHRGLHQYSVNADGTLTLSLLQAQGSLYRFFFKNYIDSYAGCQCIGTYTVEYALYPHNTSGHVIKEAALFNTGMKTAQTGRHHGMNGWESSMIEVIEGSLRLTSVKRSENMQLMLARFVNDSGHTEKAVIRLQTDEEYVFILTAQEKILSDILITDGRITLTVKPYEIITLGIKNGLKLNQ